MNRSDHTPISEELLSAYIDGALTNQERATVEAAISANPTLAWEVESLRRTVELIQSLPPIALPRSFALREDQVADVLAERRAKAVVPAAARTPRSPVAPPRQNFWQAFLAFFNSGNLLLRNATAVAAVLFVVVLVTSPSLAPSGSPLLTSAPSPVNPQADVSASPASQAEPALAAAEEPVAMFSAEAEAVAEESDAPVSDASVSDASAPMAKAASVPAAAPPLREAAPMDAAPPGMETGASSAAARAMPESRDAPASGIVSEVRGGSSLESDPALFQAAPADLSPMNRETAMGDIPAEGGLRQPINGENESAPVAESAAKASAADVPAADVPAAEVPADVPASVESDPTPLSDAPDLPWAYWGWVQAAVGGLALLLGALWLYTRRA